MSKAEKMQKRLANLQKEREEFEKQKQQLEMEMNIGKKNMGKIQKNLKHHMGEMEVLDTDSVLSEVSKDAPSRGISRKATNSANKPQLFSMNTSSSAIGSVSNCNDKGSLDTQDEHQHAIIVPSGPRISDWPFTAPLDSSPPIVKSRDLYENIRLLGRGSFGEVNLVKNVEDHKLFAIKTIFCSRDSELQAVLHELKFLRMNHHPFVIDVHDAFVTSNPRVAHIVMHYCESGTLSSVIQAAKRNKNTISEAQILKWVVQLALAMHCMHENKTVHRDLKPMNVMLTEGGDILKLADFGLAMDMRDASNGENFDEAGTPYYTAPEMIQRESYSFPTDCWSFGVILFQLLSLERPFDGASTADLVKSILTSELPPLPSHYSEEIREICRNLLKKNQSERMTMSQLLCESIIYGKAAACPQTYRPKHLEERIRRSHIRQLEQQMEVLSKQRKLIGPTSSGKYSADTSIGGANDNGLTPRVSSDGMMSQFTDPIAIPLINTVIEEGDSSLKSVKAKSPYVGKSPHSIKKSPVAQKPTMEAVNEEDLDRVLFGTERSLRRAAHDKESPTAIRSSSASDSSALKENGKNEIVPGIDPLSVSVNELVQHIDAHVARHPMSATSTASPSQQKIDAFETEIMVLSQQLKEEQVHLESAVQPVAPKVKIDENNLTGSTEQPRPISVETAVGESASVDVANAPITPVSMEHSIGGRKGRAIAQAIENDQLFERQLHHEIVQLKEQD